MTLTMSQLSQQDLSEKVCHCSKQEEAQAFVKQLKQSNTTNCSLDSLVAMYLIQDLFSINSDNDANINRIVINMEMVAEDLLTSARSLRSLASRPI